MDKIVENKYCESPVFYMGNKYKLLKQIVPLFPDECNTFVDLFGGSGVVSMNYKGKKRTIYNEFNPNIVELVKLFSNNSFETLDAYIQSVVNKYNLLTGKKRNMFPSEEDFLKDTNEKKERYNKFRTDYNTSDIKDYRDLYVLSIFSCNHLIRFNKNNEFNASFGSNGDYNENLKRKIKNGCDLLSNITIELGDALDFDFSNLTANDFVYCDPPYTNTEAVYNEKRAYGGWTEDSDKKLFKILEELHSKGIKWALSNVFINRGKENIHLQEWCKKNDWNVFHLDRNYNPFSRGNSNNDEVLVTNYDKKNDKETEVIDIYSTNKKYNIIYADPPWKYNARNNKNTKFGDGAFGKYPLMDLEDIKELPIKNITEDNCMLFLWVTFPRLQEGLEVIKAWGFDYKTLGFSWIKTNKNNDKPFFGIGYYTKSNCEVCLIGVKGKPIKISDSVSSVVISPKEEHSKKPDIVRDRIVELCGDIPRIELFARQKASGWDCWGNEVT